MHFFDPLFNYLGLNFFLNIKTNEIIFKVLTIYSKFSIPKKKENNK